MEFFHGRSGKLLSLLDIRDVRYFLLSFRDNYKGDTEYVVARQEYCPDLVELQDAVIYYVNTNVYFDAVNNDKWRDAGGIFRATSVWTRNKKTMGKVEDVWEDVKLHYKDVSYISAMLKSVVHEQLVKKSHFEDHVAKKKNDILDVREWTYRTLRNNPRSTVSNLSERYKKVNPSIQLERFVKRFPTLFVFSKEGSMTISTEIMVEEYFNTSEFLIQVYNEFVQETRSYSSSSGSAAASPNLWGNSILVPSVLCGHNVLLPGISDDKESVATNSSKTSLLNEIIRAENGKFRCTEEIQNIRYYLLSFNHNGSERFVIVHQKHFPCITEFKSASIALIDSVVKFNAVGNTEWKELPHVFRATRVWRPTVPQYFADTTMDTARVQLDYSNIEPVFNKLLDVMFDQGNIKTTFEKHFHRKRYLLLFVHNWVNSKIKTSSGFPNWTMTDLCHDYNKIDFQFRIDIENYFTDSVGHALENFITSYPNVFKISAMGFITPEDCVSDYIESGRFHLKEYELWLQTTKTSSGSTTNSQNSATSRRSSAINTIRPKVDILPITTNKPTVDCLLQIPKKETKEQECQTMSTGPIMSLSFYQ